MPRSPFICNPNSFYHITNRCINKDWFSMAMAEVWAIFEQEMFFMKHAFNIQIYSFVLMANHFHTIVRAPEGNLSEAFSFLQSMTARRVTKAQNRINHLWAHRFKRCELNSYHYFINTYKYVYQNPLRANIASKVEHYPFSTLPALLGQTKLAIPLEEDALLFNGDVVENLRWVNRLPEKWKQEAMAKALRRSVFKLPKHKQKESPLELETI